MTSKREQAQAAADRAGSIHKHRRGQYMLTIVAVMATVATVLSIVLSTASFVSQRQLSESNRALVLTTRASSIKAQDQFCAVTEREQRRQVRQLRDTYQFLSRASERGLAADDLLVGAILTTITRLETAALADPSPPLCDRPGVGIREPDPRIPRRPDVIYELPPLPASHAGSTRAAPRTPARSPGAPALRGQAGRPGAPGQPGEPGANARPPAAASPTGGTQAAPTAPSTPSASPPASDAESGPTIDLPLLPPLKLPGLGILSP